VEGCARVASINEQFVRVLRETPSHTREIERIEEPWQSIARILGALLCGELVYNL
jgi:hypothetical protein